MKLTKRELLALSLVAKGYKNEAIAKYMETREETTKYFLGKIYMKLGVDQSVYNPRVFSTLWYINNKPQEEPANGASRRIPYNIASSRSE